MDDLGTRASSEPVGRWRPRSRPFSSTCLSFLDRSLTSRSRRAPFFLLHRRTTHHGLTSTELCSIFPLPWQDLEAAPQWKGTSGKLRIGIVRDDGVVRPLAPVRRALEVTIAELEKREDIELVEFSLPDSEKNWKTIVRPLFLVSRSLELKKGRDDLQASLYTPDAGIEMRRDAAQSGEPLHPLTEWLIQEGPAEPLSFQGYLDVRLSHPCSIAPSRGAEKPIADARPLQVASDRDQFKVSFAQHWLKSGIDVLLLPVGPGPAPPHGTAKYWNVRPFSCSCFFFSSFHVAHVSSNSTPLTSTSSTTLPPSSPPRSSPTPQRTLRTLRTLLATLSRPPSSLFPATSRA